MKSKKNIFPLILQFISFTMFYGYNYYYVFYGYNISGAHKNDSSDNTP